jgi:hypothetical protein
MDRRRWERSQGVLIRQVIGGPSGGPTAERDAAHGSVTFARTSNRFLILPIWSSSISHERRGRRYVCYSSAPRWHYRPCGVKSVLCPDQRGYRRPIGMRIASVYIDACLLTFVIRATYVAGNLLTLCQRTDSPRASICDRRSVPLSTRVSWLSACPVAVRRTAMNRIRACNARAGSLSTPWDGTLPGGYRPDQETGRDRPRQRRRLRQAGPEAPTSAPARSTRVRWPPAPVRRDRERGPSRRRRGRLRRPGRRAGPAHRRHAVRSLPRLAEHDYQRHAASAVGPQRPDQPALEPAQYLTTAPPRNIRGDPR